MDHQYDVDPEETFPKLREVEFPKIATLDAAELGRRTQASCLSAQSVPPLLFSGDTSLVGA